MANLRTLRGLNSENVLAGGGGGIQGKQQQPLGQRSTRGTMRAALGDIGNRAKLGGGVTGPAEKPGALKPMKPARTGLMTRQKASSSLLQNVGDEKTSTLLQQQQARRKSARKSGGGMMEDNSPMDVEVDSVEDVEMEEVSSFPELHHAHHHIEDIDLDDRGNPQLAVEYVNEIYAYMRELEAKQFVREDYLETMGTKVSIKPKMRNLLIDWLIEVHQQFSLLQETLYLTVALIDRFLQVKAASLSTKQLQLVGVTAMWLAAKYEEMYPPEVGDFVYITDNAYTTAQIRKMEIQFMDTLQFELGRPLPLNFLRRNSKAGLVDSQAHGVAKYVMELALVEYKMAHYPPSIIAAASLAFAMRVLDPSRSSLRRLWTPTLVHYTAYGIESLAEALGAIAQLVLDAQSEADSVATAAKKKLKAVSKKYTGKKFMKIALIPELRDDVVRRMAVEGEL